LEREPVQEVCSIVAHRGRSGHQVSVRAVVLGNLALVWNLGQATGYAKMTL
jgi:hypothetical protein